MDSQDSQLNSFFSNQNFFRVCGLLGIVGNLVVVIANFIGIAVVDSYNPIRQTISDLAIGDYGWIQDIGLNLYGISLIICAIALWRWNLGDWRWRLGSVFVLLLSVIIFIISEHDQYAGLPDPSSTPVHLYTVYALGVVFPLTCLLFSFGLRKVGRGWRYFSWAIAAAWVLFGPPFFKIGTAFDGLYERFVALILLTWTTAISWLIFRHGTGAARSNQHS